MTTPPVVSLVLRLLAGPAAEGRLIGHAEIVDTGELVAVHTPQELLDLARRLTVVGTDVLPIGGGTSAEVGVGT